MSLRDTDFYKGLDCYTACAYAEGFCEGENGTQEEQLCAWQYISDNRLYTQLQGFYGRNVEYLREEGLIELPEDN